MESIFPSYKMCLLGTDGAVKQVIVFSNETDRDSNTLFSEKELEFIETNKIPVTYANQQIHLDDTIFTIKHKLL